MKVVMFEQFSPEEEEEVVGKEVDGILHKSARSLCFVSELFHCDHPSTISTFRSCRLMTVRQTGFMKDVPTLLTPCNFQFF